MIVNQHRNNHKLYYEKESDIMKQKSKMIKLVGFAVTIIGVGVNLVSDWLDEQKMDEKIEEKINEALVQKNKETEES